MSLNNVKLAQTYDLKEEVDLEYNKEFEFRVYWLHTSTMSESHKNVENPPKK